MLETIRKDVGITTAGMSALKGCLYTRSLSHRSVVLLGRQVADFLGDERGKAKIVWGGTIVCRRERGRPTYSLMQVCCVHVCMYVCLCVCMSGGMILCRRARGKTTYSFI